MFCFWGDDSYGGLDFWSCSNCKWNVDQFGIFFYVDNQWWYKYFWSFKSYCKLFFQFYCISEVSYMIVFNNIVVQFSLLL